VENTKKQQLEQIAKHKSTLTHLDALRQFLKSEVANRKETELHFERLIEERVEQITEQFNERYLKQMEEMGARVREFKERKERVEEQKERVGEYIQSELSN
jgi:hypothetical protein